MGADQYRDFATWKEPEAVLERVRLGVATRAGVERPVPPEHEGRVRFFEIDSPPIASSDLREAGSRRIGRRPGYSGGRSGDLEEGLYRPRATLTTSRPGDLTD